MGTAAPLREKNADNFLSYGKKTKDFKEKSRNIDQIAEEVYDLNYIVNHNINTVYNTDRGEGRSAWKAGVGDSGGRREILPPPEPEEVPAGRNGEQNTGPVPAGWGAEAGLSADTKAPAVGPVPADRGAEAGLSADTKMPAVGSVPAEAWAGGGERTPPGWLPDGAVRFWTPAEETGTATPSAQGDMRWAEQADRAFRRDSRRYDGGFYLY